MKRLLSVLLAALLFAGSAAAQAPDLSGLSFDQLVELRDRLNIAIWNCSEWQEVTVPAGVWKVGEDIPEGYWTIRPAEGTYISVAYCDILDAAGQAPAQGWHGWNGTLTGKPEGDRTYNERHQVDLDMIAGMYFINRGTCIFTPFTGKQDLGFK